ncbi:MAG: hypothetical protein HFJ07_09975 [Lachnospiraceae bacterium]|nr:hypothetical protein [Lachnospiraceae bacterium]
MEFTKEKQLPYATNETFQVIKKAYNEIDFYGIYEKGDLDIYNNYKNIYRDIVQNNSVIYNNQTNQYVFIEDLIYGWNENKQFYTYYFFDVDKDSCPELVIDGTTFKYVINYSDITHKFFLWYPMESTWYTLIGSQKVMWTGNQEWFAYYQLDQNGNVEIETFFFKDCQITDAPYIVMMPKYIDEKKIVLTEKMKSQAIYAKNDKQWYFRITKEQYEELTKDYFDSYNLSVWKNIEEVSYTYNELFDAFNQP